jgi:hypothetical protein
MLMGIKLQAHPTEDQKLILSQWMGCARSIWNAKCQEDKYLTTFARKYLPVNTYAPIDQAFSRYKDKELSPWLFHCPSQILRNSTVNWYQTYRRFIKGLCGKPHIKKKRDGGSIHLTKELFQFKVCGDGVTRLFIGSKTNNIGSRLITPLRSVLIAATLTPIAVRVNLNSYANADHNAAKVIKKRAINLIMDSGTELSKRGVLLLDKGRRASGKPHKVKAICVHGCETSKNMKSTYAA